MIQDVGRFLHLHHERGSARRQIILRSDASEYPIDYANSSRIRRNKAPGLSHENNKRHLSEICRLARHVRTSKYDHLHFIVR